MGTPRPPRDSRPLPAATGRSQGAGASSREPRCRYCQAPITPAQAALYGRACADWRCRQSYLAEIQQESRRVEQAAQEAWAQRVRQAAAQRDRVAAEEGRPGAETFVPVPLPFNRQRLATLPRERQEAFLEQLRQVIAAAFAEPCPNASSAPAGAEAGPADALPAARLWEQACALCRGRCCRCGANHPYLSPELIARYRRSHPEAGVEDVFQAYEGYLGAVTFEDSCVYHQPQGCGLPRALRSDTCNDFACRELRQLQQLVSASSGVPSVCLVAGERPEEDARVLFLASPNRSSPGN